MSDKNLEPRKSPEKSDEPKVTIQKSAYVSDLTEKSQVTSPFLIKFSAVGTNKLGKPYMNLVLTDRSGDIEARIWEDIPRFAGQAIRDAFVWVEGKCQVYQGRKQVVIKDLKVLREDEVEIKDYFKEVPLDREALYKTLCEFVDSMEDSEYQALARSILVEDEEIVSKIKRAPAAKSLHHAYPGGLLEHLVSITRMLDFLAKHYAPYVNRDLLFLGGFLHDIGKLWELSYDRVVDYTTEGKLIGHLVMGVELVERKVRELGTFTEEKKLLVKHLILAHHGKLEYGSPKRPKCLEALIVHYIDDLDSKVNAILTFTKEDKTPGEWTQLNRRFERFFFKPDWARAE